MTDHRYTGGGKLSDYLWDTGDLKREGIQKVGVDAGSYYGRSPYNVSPNATYHDQRDVKVLAEEIAKIWVEDVGNCRLGIEDAKRTKLLGYWGTGWYGKYKEAKKIYIAAFMTAYNKAVQGYEAEIEAEKRRPRPALPPQPKPQPKPQPRPEPVSKSYEQYAYNTGLPDDRKRIIGSGRRAAEEEVEATYPLVVRNRSEIEQLGYKINEKWFAFNRDRLVYPFTDDRKEYDNLYVTGFVSAYVNEVAKRDEKVEVKSQPAASPTGVTTTVKGVEKLADEYIYTLEIIDPNNPNQPKIIKYHEEIVEEDES